MCVLIQILDAWSTTKTSTNTSMAKFFFDIYNACRFQKKQIAQLLNNQESELSVFII